MEIKNVDGPVTRYQNDWSEIVEYGRANPGQWFEPDRRFKFSTYGSLKYGRNRLFPVGEWDISSAQNEYDLTTGIRWCNLRFRYKGKKK